MVPDFSYASTKPLGLVLSGGGARAAYQVGVLKAIAEILPEGSPNPFRVITGTSAGAINAAALATFASDFQHGIYAIERVWNQFHVEQVYRADPAGVLACAGRFLWTLAFGMRDRTTPVSLLDNAPLRELLTKTVQFKRVQECIDSGVLDALAITASGYTSGESVSFFQGRRDLKGWRRARRVGVHTRLGLVHLMASSAIPIVFPAVRIHREYFGDGALRQLAPISPALHLGAERVLVIGVGGSQRQIMRQQPVAYPSLAQVVGHIMNAAFIDSLEGDIERLQRINNTIRVIPDDVMAEGGIQLKAVDVMVLSPPGQVIDAMAARHAMLLPKMLRLFLSGSGATRASGSGVLSYLLFEAEYCQALIELGYNDAMIRREELEAFLPHGATRPVHASVSDNVIPFRGAGGD